LLNPGSAPRTQVIKRSLAPTWNETFNFDIPFQGDGKLLVECYDYDMVGDHDLIGIVSIPAREIKAKKSEWMKLTHPDNPEFNAEVRYRV
jgi:Ca2+-dependent lipid-binding protein